MGAATAEMMAKQGIHIDQIRAELQRHEHDACGLLGAVRKDGRATHQLVVDVLQGLLQMVHRSGDVDGEGDGCGLQLDIPRALWASHLSAAGLEPQLAFDGRFGVGHLLIPASEAYWAAALQELVLNRLAAEGIQVLLARPGAVNPAALGPRGSADAPAFWQVAVLAPAAGAAGDAALFRATLAIEAETPIHVASFSTATVVYKVRGNPTTLAGYYRDVADERCATRAAIGHNRYSTNTSTAFERVQPFHLLGHNGEINTIRQFREQTAMLGTPLTAGGSDSQDLDRGLGGLVHRYGLSLMEAAEVALPPIMGEIKLLSPALQDLYMYYREAWGPFAQGPAGLIMRCRDEMVVALDAMGLRPLWQVETAMTVYFTSEWGIVPLTAQVADPKPLSPGEKVGVLLLPEGARILPYHEVMARVLALSRRRIPAPDGWRRLIRAGGPLPADGGGAAGVAGVGADAAAGGADQAAVEVGAVGAAAAFGEVDTAAAPAERLLAALGWSTEDQQGVRSLASAGAEPIGSLGYDGPLACLAADRRNLADYFKESVAVVTNPAVDREREVEHFSTRVSIGPRPPLVVRDRAERALMAGPVVNLLLPLLPGGHPGRPPLGTDTYRRLAHAAGTYVYEDLLAVFGARVHFLDTAFAPRERLPEALQRLGREAVQAVLDGAQLLVVDDSRCFRDDQLWLDPHLATSAVDLALKRSRSGQDQLNLRRRCSIILHAGALRNLHDVVLALGVGADAVAPYHMYALAAAAKGAAGAANLTAALQKGLEKVISTLGIHELRGYARLFASIGLKPEVAAWFACDNYCGTERGGLGFARLKADAGERQRVAAGGSPNRLAHPFRLWPRVWKAAAAAADDPARYRELTDKLYALEREAPVALRHLLDLQPVGAGPGAAAPGAAPAAAAAPGGGPAPGTAPLDVAAVDTTIDDYAYPITISGMSFGSQGETAFRAYAEAARRLNIVAMNGEGGEIPDMVGRYYRWRGQQVASGRFGCHAQMLAGSRFMEIKVGQGAKPGEGGHLPGKKVSVKVARARNATPGHDLISPSNNHDVYSIEDLAQLVEELKTLNPEGKVVVKVPVVPGLGTIAVGIAKSGADVIAICGYDGGTGAARKHALQHAGLPVEIGVREAHLALVAAGIRERVEIWADSGVKSGLDVVKLICLGANRVGFATLAMVAIGCTICRLCQTDTCHVGICTQVESVQQAQAHGLKHFVPRVYDEATDRLVRLFTALGEEVRAWTARLGCARTQDLVGRAELLVQARGLGRVDLGALTSPLVGPAGYTPGERHGGPVRRVENPLTRELAARARQQAAGGPCELTVAGVMARDRILGTALAGEVARERVLAGVGKTDGSALADEAFQVHLRFADGSVAGNGLAAFNVAGVDITVHGGAQDGVGKGALGGTVAVLRHPGPDGVWRGGSVGKSFAYGAQRGLFIVQGDADARCCIRLSGADVILGGTLRDRLDDDLGYIGSRANLKGFAFEYMTQGRAVVLGDPGPWICSGMTGGVVYVRLQPALGLDEAALRRRLAKGARVSLEPVGAEGQRDLVELLSTYHRVLLDSGQTAAAAAVMALLVDCDRQFIAIRPLAQQADQAITTE